MSAQSHTHAHIHTGLPVQRRAYTDKQTPSEGRGPSGNEWVAELLWQKKKKWSRSVFSSQQFREKKKAGKGEVEGEEVDECGWT